MDMLTVILSRPDPDGVASAAIAARVAEGAARPAGGVVEMLFAQAQHLAEFFGEAAQRKLPASYRLVVCGVGVAHVNWDGEVIRPRLVEALRTFVRPVEWFSAEFWEPEDRAVVAHILGEGRLHVSAAASSTAALVRGAFAGGTRAVGEDAYADSLVALAEGRLAPEAEEAWGGVWSRVIPWLRDDPAALAEAAGLLAAERPGELAASLVERADRLESDARKMVAARIGEPVSFAERHLVTLEVPTQWHPFWEEVGEAALDEAGAEFCLCALTGRPVLALSRREDVLGDISGWARYVTDLLPGSAVVDQTAAAAVLRVPGLSDQPALKDEVVRLLIEGAHLLES